MASQHEKNVEHAVTIWAWQAAPRNLNALLTLTDDELREWAFERVASFVGIDGRTRRSKALRLKALMVLVLVGLGGIAASLVLSQNEGVGIGLLILPLANTLYWMKRNHPRIFGWLEVSFATIGLGFTMGADSGEILALKAIAGLFVAMKGIEDYHAIPVPTSWSPFGRGLHPRLTRLLLKTDPERLRVALSQPQGREGT